MDPQGLPLENLFGDEDDSNRAKPEPEPARRSPFSGVGSVEVVKTKPATGLVGRSSARKPGAINDFRERLKNR